MTPIASKSTPATPLSLDELYAIYLEVARRDHAWRISAMYGQTPPPPGHSPLRLLGIDDFRQRYEAAVRVPGGRGVFEGQMLRRARAYGVDVQAAIGNHRRAA